MASVTPVNLVIPDKPHERAALKMQEKRIKVLKKLLRSAKRKYHQLKGDASSYQRVVSPSPINKLPNEILLMIFEHYISENRKRVRRLLLVCKQWYNLVAHNPQMWNVIHIFVPSGEWNMRAWAASIRPFITKCLDWSLSAPLHITLDLRRLEDVHGQLIDRVYKGFLDLDDSQIPDDWIYSLDYEDLEDDATLTADCLPEHLFGLLNELTGRGEIMRRWETLEIFFPHSSPMSWQVWDIFDFPLPNLFRASLHNLPWLDERPKASLFSTMPSFSKVKALEVSTIENWDLVSFFPSSLEELFFSTHSNQPLPSDLSRFTQLRILSIRVWSRDSIAILGTKETVRIHLPCLRELSLLGRVENLGKVEFRLPILEKLTLDWKRTDFLQRPLPMMQPSQLNWSPDGDYALDLSKVALRCILQHFTDSKTLSIPSVERDNVAEVLDELSKEDALPPAWKVIAFHTGDEIMEKMGIHELLGFP